MTTTQKLDLSTAALGNLLHSIDIMEKEGKTILGLNPAAQDSIKQLATELLAVRHAFTNMPFLGGASINIFDAPAADVLDYLADRLRENSERTEKDHRDLGRLRDQKRAIQEFFGLTKSPTTMTVEEVSDTVAKAAEDESAAALLVRCQECDSAPNRLCIYPSGKERPLIHQARIVAGKKAAGARA